jgi:hypothetical protein
MRFSRSPICLWSDGTTPESTAARSVLFVTKAQGGEDEGWSVPTPTQGDCPQETTA